MGYQIGHQSRAVQGIVCTISYVNQMRVLNVYCSNLNSCMKASGSPIVVIELINTTFEHLHK